MRPFLVPDPVMQRHQRLAGAGLDVDPDALRRLCALYRIDTLAALWAAQHGWLGASFSAVELLAAVYHGFIPEPGRPLAERATLVLSKGHAAAAHYAVLAGRGAFPRAHLLDYKAAGGPPAHSDRSVAGVDADSGSLGMGLSKALGLARARSHSAGGGRRSFVILGDGELQEGQVFESLLSLRQQDLRRCVVIIDRNGLQTDSRTDQIKDARDWEQMLGGVGLQVLSTDGHDPRAVLAALRAASEGPAPTVVLAHTVKGEGSTLTRMPAADTARRAGLWHGRVPSAAQYAELLGELTDTAGDHELARTLELHLREPPARATRPAVVTAPRPATVSGGGPPSAPAPRSTADAFGAALLTVGAEHPRLHVLDADLEAPCRLSAFAQTYPERFVEVGISEQDMLSQAAGLALGGCVAVANTYAAFFKRCIDQLIACATEGLPVIAVGHYAGLDYFTDGKSHQALEDVALARAAGEIEVYEPLTAAEVAPLLAAVVRRMQAELQAGERSLPAYLRIHRTPPAHVLPLPGAFSPGRPYLFPARPDGSAAPGRALVSDPHLLLRAVALQPRLLAAGCPWDVLGVSSYFERGGALRDALRGATDVVALQSHLPPGGLGELAGALSPVPVRHLGPRRRTGSLRSFDEVLRLHGLDDEGLHRALLGPAGQR